MVRVVFDGTRGVYLQPTDLQLTSGGEQIENYEDPLAWGLNPIEYL
jgi:hypothetical protein